MRIAILSFFNFILNISGTNDNVKTAILHPPIMKIDGPIEETDQTGKD